MVRETGLEPVRDYHTPLKRARLPIPPLSQILCRPLNGKSYYSKACTQCQDFFKKKLEYSNRNCRVHRLRRAAAAKIYSFRVAWSAASTKPFLLFYCTCKLQKLVFIILQCAVEHIFKEQIQYFADFLTRKTQFNYIVSAYGKVFES